jgi:hypothetical protein
VVSHAHFATEDLSVLRNFVDQLDVDGLPLDLARASVEDATFSLAAINLQLAKRLEHAGVVLSTDEDSWKPAALAAQSQNLELQGVVADLNKRVLDLTQALERQQFQASQNSAQVCSRVAIDFILFKIYLFICDITSTAIYSWQPPIFQNIQQPHHRRNRRSAT